MQHVDFSVQVKCVIDNNDNINGVKFFFFKFFNVNLHKNFHREFDFLMHYCSYLKSNKSEFLKMNFYDKIDGIHPNKNLNKILLMDFLSKMLALKINKYHFDK